jgi:transcriptional repressor NrdR
MRCSKCGCEEDKVIDSRTSREGLTIRRRRECLACGHRFTTYEEIEHDGLMIIKRDGRAEEFSREKLLSGIKKACQKRPVSAKAIEELADRIMEEIAQKYDADVPSMAIGERVTVAKLHFLREFLHAYSLDPRRGPSEVLFHHGFVDTDNSGNRYTGQLRAGIGLAAANLAGHGDQLTLLESFRCARLKLWDESTRRLVPFSALRAARAA